jgi:hypothetical protein
MTEDIEALKARIAELESALNLKNETITSRYKLTPAMGSLFGLLIELPMVDDDLIRTRLKLAADAKVAIYRLRRQLLPYGIDVHSRRGSGWYLDEATKERVRLEVTGEVIDEAA